MKFYGRQSQGKLLRGMFSQNEMQTALIYGRRAGKSGLIKQVLGEEKAAGLNYGSQMSIMEPEAFFEWYIRMDFETRYVPAVFEELIYKSREPCFMQAP